MFKKSASLFICAVICLILLFTQIPDILPQESAPPAPATEISAPSNLESPDEISSQMDIGPGDKQGGTEPIG